MKFKTVHKFFQMNTAPVEVREQVGGQIVIVKKTKLPIEFIGGKFETDDPEQIAAIKAHPMFGTEFTEDTGVTAAADNGGPGPADEVEAKTKNVMIAYLVDVKKADPSEFAKLKVDELIAYALEKHNVKFI